MHTPIHAQPGMHPCCRPIGLLAYWQETQVEPSSAEPSSQLHGFLCRAAQWRLGARRPGRPFRR
eukprot:11181692-Lingulodinium_polyedra.AAC.1